MAATVTTTTTKTESSESTQLISIAMLVFGGFGLVLGLAAIIYAGVGANLAFEASGVAELQAKCVETFSGAKNDKYISYNGGQCGAAEKVPNSPLQATTTMCGSNQTAIGCSFDSNKKAYAFATEIGLSCTVAAGIFCILGSVPVVFNGVFGLLNKHSPATIFAGVGIGLAIPSCCGITICTGILAYIAVIVRAVKAIGTYLIAVSDALDDGVCTEACKKSKDATFGLVNHIMVYFEVLRNIAAAMIFFMLIEAIMACISCATWKKTTTQTRKTQPLPTTAPGVTVVQPSVVPAEPYVGVPVVVVDPSAPKTEAQL